MSVVTSNFGTVGRVGDSGADAVPNRALLRSYLLNRERVGLNGVVKDETPGRGTDRLEEPGRCLNFTSTTDQLSFGVNTDFHVLGDMSVSMWVNPATWAGPTQGSFLLATGVVGEAENQNALFNLYVNNSGGLQYVHEYGAGSNEYVNFGTLATGEWFLLTVVRDNTAKTVKAYVNGIQLGATFTYTNSPTGGSLSQTTIGEYHGLADSYYVGKVDDPRFFASALTESEVKQLATLGEAALTTKPHIAWLKLEEVSGDYLYDSSGNNNTATLSGHTSAVRYTGSDVPTSGLNKVGYGLAWRRTSNSDNSYHSVHAEESFSGDGYTEVVTDDFGITNAVQAVIFGLSSQDASQSSYTYIEHAIHISGPALNVYESGSLVHTHSHTRTNGDTLRVERIGSTVFYSLNGTVFYTSGTASTGTIRTHVSVYYTTRINPYPIQNGSLATISGQSHSAIETYYLPRDESNKSKAVHNQPLIHTGEAPKNGQLENSYCRVFDGIDDEINLVSPTAITGTSYTYLTWIKLNSGTVSVAGRSDIAGSYALVVADDVLYHKPNNSGSNFASASGLIAAMGGMAGSWQPVVVRRNGDGNDVDFFVGGVKYATSYTGTISNEPCTVNVIGHNNGGVFFNGSLAGFGCVDRALTDEECIAFGQGVLPSGLADFIPLSDSDQDSAVNVVNPANSGTPAGHDSSFVGRQNVFHYNAVYGSNISANNDSGSELENGWAGAGTSPPTTAFEVKDGKNAKKVTWSTSITDSGYSGSRATAAGSDRTAVVSGRTYHLRCKVQADRNLTAGEQYKIYFVAATSTNIITLTSSHDLENGWLEVEANLPKTMTLTDSSMFLTCFKDFAGAPSSDFTLWIAETQVIEADSFDGVSYLPTYGDAVPALSRRPGKPDGSGEDTFGVSLLYAPSPGVWPLSENTLNSNPNNAPRRDWSKPVNDVQHDTNFGNANWTKFNGAVALSSDVGPFGRSGDHWVFTASAATASTTLGISLGTPPAGTRTHLAIVKAGTYSIFQTIVASAHNATAHANFDLSNGTIGNAVDCTPILEPLGNGWYLMGMEYETLSASGFVYPIWAVGSLTSARAQSITTDGSETFRVAAAMNAAGSHRIYMPYGYDPNEPSDFTPNPPELLEYRSEFDNAYWTKARVTVTSNADGIADSLLETADFGSHAVVLGVYENTVVGKKYIHSVEVKGIGRDTVGLLATGPAQGFYFDLDSGSVLAPLVSAAEAGWVDALENDYYRLNIVVTSTAASMNWQMYINDGTLANYTGDVTKGVYARNASLKRYHPTNPLFFRQRTDAGKLVGIDRLTDYRQPLLGTRLSQVQKFITAKVL